MPSISATRVVTLLSIGAAGLAVAAVRSGRLDPQLSVALMQIAPLLVGVGGILFVYAARSSRQSGPTWHKAVDEHTVEKHRRARLALYTLLAAGAGVTVGMIALPPIRAHQAEAGNPRMSVPAEASARVDEAIANAQSHPLPAPGTTDAGARGRAMALVNTLTELFSAASAAGHDDPPAPAPEPEPARQAQPIRVVASHPPEAPTRPMSVVDEVWDTVVRQTAADLAPYFAAGNTIMRRGGHDPSMARTEHELDALLKAIDNRECERTRAVSVIEEADGVLAQRLAAAGVDASEASRVVSEFRAVFGAATQKARIEQERLQDAGLGDMCMILKSQWGDWTRDRRSGRVTFNDAVTQQRYDAAAADLRRVDERLMEIVLSQARASEAERP